MGRDQSGGSGEAVAEEGRHGGGGIER